MNAWPDPVLLLEARAPWAQELAALFAGEQVRLVVHGHDRYAPADIDYVLSFRPPPGLLKALPNLKAVFSLGAGVDGFLADPDYPRHVPLVRFVDNTLSEDMAQYAVLHVLMFHRNQRALDAAQREGKWAQALRQRATRDTRIGILGLGEIGQRAGRRLFDLGFPVCGWSRTHKEVSGVRSLAGADALPEFLAQSDVLVCLLPLTPGTRRILNADTFALLPKGAFVINAARGGHLVETDLIAAIDSGHLAGAALDVFESEPLAAASPLWRHPRVTVTPHIAAVSDPRGVLGMVLDGIRRHRAGEPLISVVDFSRGY